MFMHTDAIRSLIQQQEYDQALAAIERRFRTTQYDLTDEDQFKEYTKLLQLRVTARTMLDGTDSAILELARKEKYPDVSTIEITEKHSIRLIDQNISLIACDAVVNSIHIDKHFDYAPISYSQTFLQVLGSEEINRQLNGQFSQKNFRGFVTLQHPHLAARMSYHIPAYFNNNEVDIDALRRGIVNVIRHANNAGFQHIAFAPLGMSCNCSDDERKLIIDGICDAITTHLRGLGSKSAPLITFSFSRRDTFNSFEDAMRRRSKYGVLMSKMLKELNDNQRELINATGTKSDEFTAVLKEIAYVASEPNPILLLGETGVGKSFIARHIHNISGRPGSFHDLNCASITPEQLYVFVFGHTKGAFTSVEDEESIFEKAAGGTVFFDEIGYASKYFQQSLLLFLDRGEYRKPGVKEPLPANVRLIFGTNQDPDVQLNRGLLMHDFHARIASSRVFTIPPLRERPTDIPPFAERKLEQLHRHSQVNGLGHAEVKITAEAIELLQTYPWPGNVRQLVHYIENIYYNALYASCLWITAEMIQQRPPRVRMYGSNLMHEFEDCVRPILDSWDHRVNGSFLNNFVEPILAKMYLDEFGHPKKDAKAVLGLDGERGDASLLMRAYKRYEKTLKSYSSV